MHRQRILILGSTGIDKKEAMKRLARWCEDTHGHRWRFIDFETAYLWPGSEGETADRDSFLDGSHSMQSEEWRKNWQRLCVDVEGIGDHDGIVVGIHGSFTRGYYGARCPVNINMVSELYKPDLIITLIADVYNVWWRTESVGERGASDDESRPTLEQLIFARRIEVIVGDLIAHACHGKVQNFVLSAYHPLETFGHLIYADRPRVVYLSFPISQPREMQEAGDKNGFDEVTSFITDAYDRQRKSDNLIVECPLGIDEIPFVRALPPDPPASGFVEFDRDALRWSMDAFWPRHDRLIPSLPKTEKPFPFSQMRDASGIITTDVTLRDYRLVDQANYVAVFNPIYNNRDEMAGSVRQEIDHAISDMRKTVYIYQAKNHDTRDIVGIQLGVPIGGRRSTMRSTGSTLRKKRVYSPEELLDTAMPKER